MEQWKFFPQFLFLVIRQYFIWKLEFCQHSLLTQMQHQLSSLFFVWIPFHLIRPQRSDTCQLTNTKILSGKGKIYSGEFSNLLYRPNILSSLIMMMMMLLRRLFGYLNRKFYREFSQILLSVVWKETFNNNNNLV